MFLLNKQGVFMSYIKYTTYSAAIVFFVGVFVLSGLRYFVPKEVSVFHYYYMSYGSDSTLAFCLNDPRESIKYRYKEEVIYVRPIIRPSITSVRHRQVVDSSLKLPKLKDVRIQKDSMELYLDSPEMR
jgi:hypothetical protein